METWSVSSLSPLSDFYATSVNMKFNIFARSRKVTKLKTIWQNTKYKPYTKEKRYYNAIHSLFLLF